MKKLALLAVLVGGMTFGIGAATASAHGPVYGPVYPHHHHYVAPGYRIYRPYRPVYAPVYAPVYRAPACGGVYVNTPNFGVGFGW